MPAKLKKITRLEASVSTEIENQDLSICNHRQTVSTKSENLLIDHDSSYFGRDTVITDIGVADTTDNIAANSQTTDNGPIDNQAIGDGSNDFQTCDNFAPDNDGSDNSISPVTDVGNTPEDTAGTPPQKCCTTPSADNSTSPKIVVADERTNLNPSMKVLNSDGILNSEFSGKQDSNLDISGKSDDIIASSVSERNDDLTLTSELPNDNSENSNVISISNQDILGNLNATENSTSENCRISDECQTAENLGTPLKLPSATNCKTKFVASPSDSCYVDTNYENPATESPQSTGSFPGKPAALVASNTQTYYSVTSNSEKYFHKLQQPLNFPNYPTEIPRNVLNTEVQTLNPVLVADSEFMRHESTKSFEESINSTFLKYFPEIPKRSFNSPLTSDSGKYFRDNPKTVGSSVDSDSQKYIQDHGNQALVFSDKEGIPEQPKVSSIDFLNSMVENIGKPSV